jgi:hypothetical protein
MQRLQRKAEIVAITGIVRIQFDRALDARDRRAVVAVLMAAHSGQVPGLGLFGCFAEDGGVQTLRLIEVPGLVVLAREAQCILERQLPIIDHDHLHVLGRQRYLVIDAQLIVAECTLGAKDRKSNPTTCASRQRITG